VIAETAWFGTRRSVVRIPSPRPSLPSRFQSVRYFLRSSGFPYAVPGVEMKPKRDSELREQIHFLRRQERICPGCLQPRPGYRFRARPVWRRYPHLPPVCPSGLGYRATDPARRLPDSMWIQLMRFPRWRRCLAGVHSESRLPSTNPERPAASVPWPPARPRNGPRLHGGYT